MEFSRWKFSEHVKPELQKFLNVVQSNQNFNESAEELKKLQIWRHVLPQLPISTYNLQNNDITLQHTDKNIITIDEDSVEFMDTNNSHKNDKLDIRTASIPDLSIINLTLVETEDVSLNLKIKDFIVYLNEIQDDLLQNKDIKKLSSEFDTAHLKELFKNLNDTLSNHSVLNLGQSICIHSSVATYDVARCYCKYILLNKLTNSESMNELNILIKEFAKIYPDITIDELLLPILNVHHKCGKAFQLILKMLEENSKQKLLGDFVFSCSKLEVWQLIMLQPIIYATTEDSVKRRIINLMSVSTDEFNNDNLCIKILISLVQNLGEGFVDEIQLLQKIIDKNKTLLKGSAQKALNEWVNNNCHDF